MSKSHTRAYRIGLTGAAILLLVLVVFIVYLVQPRHWEVQVSASDTPEQIIGQYIEASNHSACSDANSLLRPGARYSLCRPAWNPNIVDHYSVFRDIPGSNDYSDELGTWNQARMVDVHLEIRSGLILRSHRTRDIKFYMGRNSDAEPWRITYIGFLV